MRAGRHLIDLRSRLAASERQSHFAAWARRLAVDKSLEKSRVAKDKVRQRENDETAPRRARSGKEAMALAAAVADSSRGMFANELSSDPKGIGFAFGGIDPGRLHAYARATDPCTRSPCPQPLCAHSPCVCPQPLCVPTALVCAHSPCPQQ